MSSGKLGLARLDIALPTWHARDNKEAQGLNREANMELKPCPKCHSKDVSCGMIVPNYFRVRCNACGFSTGDYWDASDARRGWNRLHRNPPPPAPEPMPCPGCGYDDPQWHISDHTEEDHFVRCWICGMQGPQGRDQLEAIKAWNSLPRKAP
jgi:transcription elongation factor Elf1